MMLSSSAFAQTGADSDIFYNARIVFSDQHTMHFQLALGAGQGASQGSCFIINGEEWLALTSLGSDQAGISHWAFPFQAELTIQPHRRRPGRLIRQNGNRMSASLSIAESATVIECDASMERKRFPEGLFGQSTFDSPRHPLAERYDLRLRIGKENEVHAVGEFFTHSLRAKSAAVF
jgi:hypothetical protein